ncbi:MAG: flavodoxin [Candidatus Thermofonsia Clade 1 bacterium]|uniref:Flavodoxin n=1 Tax=Candidatus Thermofonsia Clade 1 bacterium TaxID=2364210 RepID=A0A2M8PI16_9CHLR|nr:MAG: flavodoxin [Candidatus Thermofonsia Clade 1 bacterium]
MIGLRTCAAEGQCAMQKLLIAYATRAGSTAQVAEFMGKVLREAGLQVDVMPVKQVRDLSGYSGVILGSPIRMGSVLPELIRFVKAHAQTLSRLPLAYFNVNLTLMDDTPEARAIVDSYFNPLRVICAPLRVGAFAGKMDYARLNSLLRFLLARNRDQIPEGDWIDWQAVRQWALELLPLLQGERTSA